MEPATREEQFFPHVRSDICLYAPHRRTVCGGWTCGLHVHHMMFEFILVTRGTLSAFAGHTAHTLTAGDLFLVSPMQLHGYRAPLEEGCSFVAGHIGAEDEELLELFESENACAYPAGHPLTEALSPSILGLFNKLEGPRPPRVSAVMLGVLEIIERIHAGFAAEAARKKPAARREPAYLIAREIERLLRRPQMDGEPSPAVGPDEAAGDWLEDIARRLNISRRHCHRLFRQAYGMSPRQYLMILKQQEAMQMLDSSTDTVEQIAYRLGYVNVQSFIRQFTTWVGCTPGAFRRNRPDSAEYFPPSLSASLPAVPSTGRDPSA
ncbi:helix-turn-helix domain-containing protein [Paenibacillus spiritus]|uniref:Helix-turn-helix domain-containing protein n=1 Tax=Paenibacillus spiritus TaxID=2496557 RepID=A0A5J5GHG7_9BACL|nr:AraC family transcriptional regulator [Paenibacillus spiritus]KAA9007669.1 helix-turn-helix domain-containing protein [Paenibacillus spiritus]